MRNRKPQTLNEELNKMRKLMGFDISENSHDVLSESNIEKSLIGEQEETITDKYGEYDFSASFPDNYITPKKESYEPIIKKMIEDYKKAIAEGKTLEEIDMTVESSASSRRASNRYTEPTAPNHDYGGLLKKYAPEGWVKATPDNPKKIIEGGNKFLAEKRGETLKKIVVESLNTAGIKIDANKVNVDWKVSDSPDKSEQYVKVLVKGLLEKVPDIPEEKPLPYSIVVDWYKIGSSSTPYILIGPVTNSVMQKKSGNLLLWNATVPGGPDGSSWNGGNRFRDALKSSSDDVKVGGFNFYPKTAGNARYLFKAFGVIENYTNSDGNIFYFDDRDTWMDQVKKMNRLTPKESGRRLKFNGSDKEGMFDEIIYATGGYDDKQGQASFASGFIVGSSDTSFYGLKPSSGDAKKIKEGEDGFYYGKPVKLIGYKAAQDIGQATQPEPTEPKIK
jgi:hypothetical protein